MQYVFLCYHREKEVFARSKDQEAAVMEQLAAVEAKLRREGRLGPAARLMPTTTATTLLKDRDPPLVVDGPFAETKGPGLRYRQPGRRLRVPPTAGVSPLRR